MRVGLVTLGCDKNTVDNEYLAGLIGTKGHSVEIADEKHPPDCVVITTCAFLEVAKEQSRDQIRRWVRIRKDHGTRLGVIGCMSQRHGPELMRDFPEIDFLAGVGQFDKVAELVCGDGRSRFVTDTAEDARSWNLTQQSGGDAPEAIPYDDREFAVDAPRVIVPRTLPRQRMDRRPHGFLKISDGCNHTCTFCSIPLMKGVYTSVPRQTLMDETRRLLDDGVREINIVAQDITKYGLDTEKRMALPDLLNDLCTIGGDFWIRLFYLYPSTVTKDLLAVVRDNPKIARYLDIPLQHLSESVLKRMRRPHDRKRTMEMLRSIRSEFPEITLRTTFIVGFPGESGAEFQELLDGMDEIKFERLGVFTYSREAGTPAADLPNQLPERMKKTRRDKIMKRQAATSAEWAAAQVGRTRRILIEGGVPDSDWYVGRSDSEAADIDGVVRVHSAAKLNVGDFVEAKIVASDVYDLTAKATVPALK
jgi:ribosomal protein S12 methylthiotransferase